MTPRGAPLFGASPVPGRAPAPAGRFVDAFGERFYVIDGAQELAPFLVTVASDSDHWLFVASNGALTAGRGNPGRALFPYVTEDKLVDAAGRTGPWTSLVARRGGPAALWHPLREADRLVHAVHRRLYRSVLGHRLVFEEENAALGLRFRSGWRTSERFGFVRECELENLGADPVHLRILDGLLDVLPAGVDERLQRELSCLVDAYKRTERIAGTSLAVYALTSQVIDRPEPRESLRANVVWSDGVPGALVHLSQDAVAPFDRGEPPGEDAEACGRRGAYLVDGELALAPGAAARWTIVADVDLPQRAVASLAERLRAKGEIAAEVRADAERGAERLRRLLAATDGLQRGGDELATAHHGANVLFNDLRGGVPAFGHDVPGPDLAAFVRRASPAVAERHAPFLEGLAERTPRAAVVAGAAARGDPQLERLARGYLSLAFGRRHGDPSRPWNRFDVRVRDARGGALLEFQGNWRDIFQNWEALALSHPAFLPAFVARFLDGSTADGHNPYRIARDGVEWEVPDAQHPWAAIGYWGDHQIVYLGRLLALWRRHDPAGLQELLPRALFAYADVPYELAPFEDLVRDPRRSITFDGARHARILERCRASGADGRLVHRDGAPVLVTLVEKLVVPALAKLANLVPGGGIWMNTQRPEWNDANNALAGWGLSVVTLCHLERHLELVAALLAPLRGGAIALSAEVSEWLEATLDALARHRPLLSAATLGDGDRGGLLRALGEPASRYRAALYRRGLSGPVDVPAERVLDLASLGADFVKDSVARTRRADGLHHSYNLLVPRPGGFGVEPLPEMLEGQVAVLGTSLLDPAGADALLGALRRSALYRPDLGSYLLQPDRRPPGFLEKNVLPHAEAERSPLLARMISAGDDRIVGRDAAGRIRFNEALVNADALREALARLGAEGAPGLDDAEVERVLGLYERVFHHHAFTGRSGAMFAYEGLGSVYWHMVGKLLVAVQERVLAAADAGAPPATVDRLAAWYAEIRAGLGGTARSPAEWGAFPLDPYSHTPAAGGARQPGMTGQVKEEIVARFGELGVEVREGRLAFRPLLLRRSELLSAPAVLETWDVEGAPVRLEVPPGALAFTYCQVPVVYRAASAGPRIAVTLRDGRREVAGARLDAATSGEVLGRTGRVRRVDVDVVLGR
jgi:hypothetical protein